MAVSPYRILFVEDDDQVRLLLEEAMRDEGYEVEAVATIAAAQELLAGNRYNLVLTDGRLPDGTGFSVAREASEKDIDVLVCTGYGLEFSDKDRASFPILAKPVRISDLLVVIRHFLGEDIARPPQRRTTDMPGARRSSSIADSA